jgi:hypothetical protein
MDWSVEIHVNGAGRPKWPEPRAFQQSIHGFAAMKPFTPAAALPIAITVAQGVRTVVVVATG